MGRKVYIKADDDTVLEELRRGELDGEVTEIELLKPNDEDAKSIAEVLQKNTNLESLEVKSGTFGDEGAIAIANALKEINTLKTLGINGSRKFGIEGANAFAEALRSNNMLENFHVSMSFSQAECGTVIFEALRDNSALRRLAMGKLNVDSAKALAQLLYHNNMLRVLNISCNNIGSEGAKAIAEALETNRSLYSLDLSYCDLGDEGGVAIGEALKSNTGLLALDLGSNRLRDREITAIAQGLETNDALRILDIASYGDEYDNRIGDAGARSLRKSLETNHALAVLKIGGSYHSGSWYISRLVAELASGLKKNRTLARLDISSHQEDGKFSPSDKKTLVDAAIVSGSKNISRIHPFPGNIPRGDEWRELRYRNVNAAEALLEKIRKTPDEPTEEDLRNCEKRLSAILYRARDSFGYMSLDGVEEMAAILDTLKRRTEEIARQTALQIRLATNDRVRNDLSHYAQDNGLTFEQMCREIALYRADQ